MADLYLWLEGGPWRQKGDGSALHLNTEQASNTVMNPWGRLHQGISTGPSAAKMTLNDTVVHLLLSGKAVEHHRFGETQVCDASLRFLVLPFTLSGRRFV